MVVVGKLRPADPLCAHASLFSVKKHRDKLLSVFIIGFEASQLCFLCISVLNGRRFIPIRAKYWRPKSLGSSVPGRGSSSSSH